MNSDLFINILHIICMPAFACLVLALLVFFSVRALRREEEEADRRSVDALVAAIKASAVSVTTKDPS